MELLQHPVMEAVLVSIIFLSILAEIKTAGFSGGGLVAAAFGVLLLWSHWSDSGWALSEALLYFGGIFLIVLDLLFLATGAAAAAGLAAMAASLYFLLGTGLSALYILAAGLVAASAGMFFLASRLPENRLWKKISLSASLSSQKGYVSSPETLDRWVGKTGTAQSVLRPAGKADVEGTVLDAVTSGEFIEAGAPIVVVRAEPGRVVVKRR